MKSGINPIESNVDRETELAFTSLFMAFTQNALVRAGKYTEHNKRCVVTINDIRNALKVETFKFLDNDNSQTIGDWRNYLENINNTDEDCDEDDEDCDDDIDEDDYADEDDSVKKCDCPDCNEFYSIDERWVPWIPEEGIPKILKDHIDKHF